MFMEVTNCGINLFKVQNKILFKLIVNFNFQTGFYVVDVLKLGN